MSKKVTVNTYSSLGVWLFTGLLVYLKVTGAVTWSWWWVLAPLWVPAAIVLTLFALMAIFAAIVAALAKK